MDMPPLETMRREMRVDRAAVPSVLPGKFYDADGLQLAPGGFLFTAPGGTAFHYRIGRGITVQPAADDDDGEFEIFLWGTVFGAVAWYNGYVPLHASAVSRNGRVTAFTADSGGGKSTLAAALAGHGFFHVCDDTLVIAPFHDGRLLALPDGKPLKLWDDALGLTGNVSEAPIPVAPGKHYARTLHSLAAAQPLTDLIFLDRGDRTALTPITGAAKLALLPGAMYRPFIHTARASAEVHWQVMTRIAAQVRFWRLSRPFDPDRFSETLDQTIACLDELENPQV